MESFLEVHKIEKTLTGEYINENDKNIQLDFSLRIIADEHRFGVRANDG